jgi:phage/plasmid-like protein (TIGR03299 family)
MPHQVEKMFSVREVPWHKPLTGDATSVLEDYPQTFEEARVLAGLDWDPVEEEVLTPVMSQEEFQKACASVLLNAKMSVEDQILALTKVHQMASAPDPGFRRIARSDTGATLSYQMDSYAVIPNSAFGEIIDAVVQQDKVRLETGGCLAEGRKVWMLAALDEPIEVPGDRSLTLPHLAITSRHDGKGSTALRATAVRIVCGNTFDASEVEGKRTGAVYSFIHRGNWRDKLDDARKAVTFARREFKQYSEVAMELMGIHVDARQTQIFVNEFLPMPPPAMATGRVIRNVETSRGKLLSIMASPTIYDAGVLGTAYGLVQAAGEYCDWSRDARSWETRLNRSLLTTEPQKARAAQLAREVAKA